MMDQDLEFLLLDSSVAE